MIAQQLTVGTHHADNNSPSDLFTGGLEESRSTTASGQPDATD
jgi:hypothetical protein